LFNYHFQILKLLFSHCCQHILALLGKGQCFSALSGVRPSTLWTVVKEVVDDAGHNNTGGWLAEFGGGKGPNNRKR